MRKKGKSEIDAAIVGLGNWGASLAAALAGAGVPLREIVVRGRKRLSPRSGVSVTPVAWSRAALEARVLWLCVPDGSIATAAAQIVRRRDDLHGQIVVHSSGALGVDVLEAARRAGATVASVHPAMSFPTAEAVPLKGVLFGVEAEDAATKRLLKSLVRRLGGRPFDLSPETKALYHAAGTLASPLVVSALKAAMQTAGLAGLDRTTAELWVGSLARASMGNVFARGAERSFSGPFARGDVGTIQLHLRALGAHPILAGVYRSLAEHAVVNLPVRNAEKIIEALRESSSGKPKPRGSRRSKPVTLVRN